MHVIYNKEQTWTKLASPVLGRQIFGTNNVQLQNPMTRWNDKICICLTMSQHQRFIINLYKVYVISR